MNPYSKNPSNPHISHHSFENSLQQIHQTNDLLSNIENKISDFMGKDSKSTAVFKERSPVGPSGLNSSRSRTSYHPAREENSPLKTRNSTYQDFAQYLSPPNDVKSPPNPVNYASNSQSQGNIQPFTAGDYASVGSVARESIDMYNYNSNPISRNTINRKEYPMERETSGRALIDKMNRIEESYEAKIKLLEERLRQSESEAYSLKDMNQTLEHQIGQLKTEAFQWQDRFKKDYANSEDERGIVRTLKKEMETLDRKYRSVLEDKDRLKRQYNELMRVHNQMIELDMQRNEKSLMESRRAEHNEEQNNEEVQGLVESINAYKQEVDFLKENNNLMQVQLKYEVEKLQDDLNRQIEENQRLRNGIREDKLVALGSRSPSAIGTTHKKSIRDITERSGQRMTTGNYEEEDLKALGREELVRYAKGLKDMFLNLEEQHHDQVRYNENLQTELESLRRDNTDRVIRNASPNGLESNRKMNTSYLRTSTRKSPKKEFYSEDRTKRGYDASVERRKRLLNLQRDLDNVDPGERFLKTKEIIPRKSRSRSRSVKFSPDRGGKGERISFGQPKESVETARSNGEFERELAKLKQMIGEKVPLKRIKERPTKKDAETSGRADRSDLKGKVKPKTKVVKEKEKKKKL